MRILRLSCVVVLTLTLGACANDSRHDPGPKQSAGVVTEDVMPLAADLGSQEPSGSDELVRTLHAQWGALLGSGSRPVSVAPVGIIVRELEDSITLSCKRVEIDPSGGYYCRLVSRDQFNEAAPSGVIVLEGEKLQAAIGHHENPVSRQIALATIVAHHYVLHLRSELNEGNVAWWTTDSWAQQCLTGVSLRSLVVSDKVQVMLAAESTRDFRGSRMPVSTDYQAVVAGYSHGSPMRCLKP